MATFDRLLCFAAAAIFATIFAVALSCVAYVAALAAVIGGAL